MSFPRSQDAGQSAVVVQGLTKRYGDLLAVDDVSFEVAAGAVVALVGPNGAGKTTTVEILEGFRTPTSGSVLVLGQDPGDADRHWRSRVGLVLQSSSLDLQLSVREALSLFAGLFEEPLPVAEVLARIDLEQDADARIGQLSGGQQRRVDIGLGIVGRPELLFLDEPTTGLDPIARRQVWDAIDALSAAGCTVLLTTHSMEEVERLADRAIVIAAGRIVADASPEELRTRTAQATIRYALPAGAPRELPAPLSDALDLSRDELVLRTDEVAAALEALLGWARCHNLDLLGLQVGPPSLEDAYLELVAGNSGTVSYAA